MEIALTTDARLMSPDIVTVYGAAWCEDTTRAREHFDAAGMPYRYVDLDEDVAAKAQLTDAGYLATPTVVTATGQVFVEPSNDELDGIVGSASPAVAVE